ncbi:MAG: hypothetical protein HYX67_14600 [Candidatus Melainabacteria bacterium]|nr:hypothetical protein [Candidatus Melainabacteria bacterium]
MHKLLYRLTCFFIFLNGLLNALTREELQLPHRKPCPPYITGDAFRAHCDFIFDETNSSLPIDQINDRSTIFVGPYVLHEFFEVYHPLIKANYILVTHNTDYAYPGPYRKYLDDEKIIAWFSQNVEDVIHPKLFPIPIGFGNRYTYHFDLKSVDDAKEFLGQDRDILLLMNLRITHPERAKVINIFKDKPFCTSLEQQWSEFLKTVTRTKFILSPRGNGWDCHRTWEALELGAIPIVTSTACREMFDGLPVLFINDWTEVTEEFLNKSYDEIMSKNYNLEKLNIGYWLSLIDYAKEYGRPPEKMKKSAID